MGGLRASLSVLPRELFDHPTPSTFNFSMNMFCFTFTAYLFFALSILVEAKTTDWFIQEGFDCASSCIRVHSFRSPATCVVCDASTERFFRFQGTVGSLRKAEFRQGAELGHSGERRNTEGRRTWEDPQASHLRHGCHLQLFRCLGYLRRPEQNVANTGSGAQVQTAECGEQPLPQLQGRLVQKVTPMFSWPSANLESPYCCEGCQFWCCLVEFGLPQLHARFQC